MHNSQHGVVYANPHNEFVALHTWVPSFKRLCFTFRLQLRTRWSHEPIPAWYSRLLMVFSLLVSTRSSRLECWPCLCLLCCVTCWYRYASLTASMKCWLLWLLLVSVVINSQSISEWLKSIMISKSSAFRDDSFARMLWRFSSSVCVLDGLRYAHPKIALLSTPVFSSSHMLSVLSTPISNRLIRVISGLPQLYS